MDLFQILTQHSCMTDLSTVKIKFEADPTILSAIFEGSYRGLFCLQLAKVLRSSPDHSRMYPGAS